MGDKQAVILRDGGLCVLALDGCLGEAQTTDHRVNRGSGGSRLLNEKSNLIGACTLCNGRKADAKGELRERLIARGVTVIPDSTHAKSLTRAINTPVRYPDGIEYWLTSDGRRVPVGPDPEF